MTTWNLLIVDDEYLITESLSTMEEWESRHIRVIGTASSGREAIEWIEHHDVDIVITDIRMPDMDGMELLQHLFEHNPSVKVIVISGYEEFSYVHAALKYKAIGYVLKPIDTEELLALVDEAIAPVDKPKAEELPPATTYHDKLIEEALTYIHQYMAEEITLKDTAQQLHLTPHYFGQVFKAGLNETFISYLTRVRMEKACEWLRNSELKLYEVGLRVGYRDPRYFTRTFRKYYGITPKQFRSNLFKEG